MKGRDSSLGYRLVFIQFLVAFGLAGLLYLMADGVAAYSALAGGLISALSNVYFAARLFSDNGSWRPKQIASNVFKGESGKLILTGVLFLLAMILIRPLNAAMLFVAYLLVQLVPLIAVNGLHRD